MKITKLVCLVIAAGLCVSAVLTLSMLRPLDSDLDSDQRARTKAVLSLCGQALDEWSNEHKRLPSAEEGLSVLEMKVKIPKDGWGRPIIFRRSDLKATSGFHLYSTGENGTDENGNGDDLNYR